MTKLILRPRTNADRPVGSDSAAPRPSASQLASAAAAAIVASLAADVVLVTIGTAAFNPPASFGPFSFATYAALTVAGVVGATAFWAVCVRALRRPTRVLYRVAVAVTAVSLIPDFLLLPHDSTGAVGTLMAMHAAIAIITTWSLVRIAPSGRLQ